MKAANEFFEVSMPGFQVSAAKSYEVVRPEANGQVSRLGWAIETDTEGERHWVAFAVLSANGDSFLGTFKSANEALWALYDNEQKMAEQREAQEL